MLHLSKKLSNQVKNKCELHRMKKPWQIDVSWNLTKNGNYKLFLTWVHQFNPQQIVRICSFPEGYDAKSQNYTYTLLLAKHKDHLRKVGRVEKP